ncbi:MAG: tyrosine-type recombinase/integrase [Deinococcus sp.]|nr:tyrosine-type recombinase/integrase [Deinococcus sp.]
MSLVLLSSWSNPSKRRVAAVRAAHERNEQALLELLEAYLVLKGRKRAAVSEDTVATYHKGVRDYLAWAWPPDASGPKVEILKATSDDLDRYVTELQVNGGHLSETSGVSLKPSTIATYLAGVRTLYRAFEWAKAAQMPQGVFAPRDPTPPEERRPALPVHLYRKLLDRLTPEKPDLLRDRVAVRLMAEAGLRISEVIQLVIADLHFGERILIVKHGKGGKQRSVPLSNSLVADLEAWLRIRTGLAAPGETRVLINMGGKKADGKGMSASMLRKTLAKHYSALGFPTRYYGAHMLRHTAGTRFYKASRDLHATARLLGHSNVNTSAIYAKMDLEGLFDVVDKLDSESE